MNYIAVITTVARQDEARAIARNLVERKLAACAQISEIESFYTWENTLQNEKEFRIVFKTTLELYSDIEAELCKLHSCELPAIYSLPIKSIYEPFSDWIKSSLK